MADVAPKIATRGFDFVTARYYAGRVANFFSMGWAGADTNMIFSRESGTWLIAVRGIRSCVRVVDQ